MRSKSTRMSLNTPFFYADLELGCELAEATQRANAQEQADQQSGLDIGQLEQTLRALVGNSAFEDTEEDAGEFEDLLVDGARPGEAGCEEGSLASARSARPAAGGSVRTAVSPSARSQAVIRALQLPQVACSPVNAGTALPTL
jgi:hypothetical protein